MRARVKAASAVSPGRACILIGLMVSLPGAISAAQWYSESSVRIRGVYDDNIRLSRRYGEDVTGSILSGRMKAGRRTEITDINLSGSLDLKRYSGDDSLDTNNGEIEVDLSHRTERNQFGLNAGLVLDSTLTSELESSGRTQASKRRIRKTFAPSWTHTLSERTALTLSYTHVDTKYRDARLTGLYDYKYLVLGTTLTHRLNQKTQVAASLNASLYKASNRVDSRTRDIGLTLGVSRDFSENFRAGIAAGMRYSETKYKLAGGDEENSDSGYLLNANMERSFEQAAIRGEFSHLVQPSGAGALLVSDRLILEADYKLSERLSWHLVSRVYRNSAADEKDSSQDRTYLLIEPKVRWRVTRRWDVEGSFRYRRQKRKSEGTVDSNAVFVSVRHAWPSRPVTK
ncbi:MAG TPA: hypothetical protein ENI99_12630 [Sedimenticola sp.]|nr:hypothetical protein [Sedimenticola sp.]